MAISDRISAMYDHVEDIYDTMALDGDTTSNKNIVNINTEIKREYKDFLANGTDTLWNNWEKVSGSGETLTLNNTMEGKMKVDLKGNTQQNGTPTPDTPIPVQVVSGNNSIDVVGKNFFNIPSVTPGTSAETYEKISENAIKVIGSIATSWRFVEVVGIEVKPNTTYYFKSKLSNSNSNITSLWIFFKDMDNNPIYQSAYSSDEVKTISIGNVNKIKVNLYCNAGAGTAYVNTATWSDIQLTTNSNDVFTPYVSQSYPINLPFELCKIGDYQDRVFKAIEGDSFYDTLDSATKNSLDTGSWYKYGAIGKVVLDGSETITIFIQQQNRTIFAISGKTNDIETYNFSTLIPSILSSHFKPTSQTSAWVVGDISRRKEEQTTIYLVYEPNTTIEDFQTWLSTHNTEVYYVLATPTYEEITDTTLLSQLEALAYSYEGTTNISQENDDLASELDVVALQEM